MATPINVIHSATKTAIPINFQLSGFLGLCFQLVHRIHRVWYWFRRIDNYTNPDNFLKLAAGHTLNVVAGDRTVVRIAAHAVLIAARITETIEEQVALVQESKSLWVTLSNPYPLHTPLRKNMKCHNMWLSPSTKHWWKVKFQAIVDRITRVVKAIIRLARRLFLLSMKTMDAATAFSFGTDQRQESLNELMINGSKCMDALVKNKDMLLRCLHKNKGIVSHVLSRSSTIFSIDQLIDMIEKGISVTESIHMGIETASHAVGIVGSDLVKRATFGVFQAAGLADLMPNGWMPPMHPVWMEDKCQSENKSRFPEPHLVTLYKDVDQLIDYELNKKLEGIELKGKMSNNLLRSIHSHDEKAKLTKKYTKLYKVEI